MVMTMRRVLQRVDEGGAGEGICATCLQQLPLNEGGTRG